MPNKIERLSSVTSSLSLAASESTTPLIPYGASAAGMVFVSAVSGATKIAWYSAATGSDVATPVYDSGNAVETFVSAGRSYPIPDACFAAPFLKLVLDSGTATATISLKG
jgi:hypothetical protein